MAASEEDLIKLNSKLKKISDGHKEPEEAYRVFEILEQLQVTAESIQNSRLVVTINELRKKTKDEKLAKRGKALIRQWKNYFESQASSKSVDEPIAKKPLVEKPVVEKKSSTPPSDDSNSNPPASKNHSQPMSKPVFTKREMPTDEKRAKIVTDLLNSLKNGELPEHTQDPEEVATRIEASLFEKFGDVNQEYFSAARSRASNLRDKKNPDLRVNVLTGAVTAERFAQMPTDEMASKAMKEQREAFTKEAIMEHQMSVQEGTPSDMFRCGRCGKNNCTYTQVQTRSADEPMTTFVFCRSCGNRWKFC